MFLFFWAADQIIRQLKRKERKVIGNNFQYLNHYFYFPKIQVVGNVTRQHMTPDTEILEVMIRGIGMMLNITLTRRETHIHMAAGLSIQSLLFPYLGQGGTKVLCPENHCE